jgi:hypothetical protein
MLAQHYLVVGKTFLSGTAHEPFFCLTPLPSTGKQRSHQLYRNSGQEQHYDANNRQNDYTARR